MGQTAKAARQLDLIYYHNCVLDAHLRLTDGWLHDWRQWCGLSLPWVWYLLWNVIW
jgi:hypothetical protein